MENYVLGLNDLKWLLSCYDTGLAANLGARVRDLQGHAWATMGLPKCCLLHMSSTLGDNGL